MEETNNPIVEKLLDFAKNKSYLTWDEVTEFLGQDFVNSPEMESIIKILNEKNIQLIEPSIIQPDDVPEDDDVGMDDEDEDSIMLDQDDDVSSDDESEVAEIESAEKNLALEASKNRLVNSDKDSNIDDPIRLYLRDIGKENLLSAEDEVTLSKTM